MTIHIETLVRAAQKSAATTALLLGFILATLSSSAGDDSRDNLKSIKHIIVIYQENWSFDSLYGQFPGADGYANSLDTLPQLDRLAAPPYSSLGACGESRRSALAQHPHRSREPPQRPGRLREVHLRPPRDATDPWHRARKDDFHCEGR